MNGLSAIDWQLVGAFLLSGAVITWVSQFFKRWKGLKGSGIMQTLSGSFALIAAGAQYIHTLPIDPTVPVTHMFQTGSFVWIASQFVYQASKLLSMLFGRAAEEPAVDTPAKSIAVDDVPAATGEFI